MKSARQSAMGNTLPVKPRNITMPREAMKILVKLERLRNYNNKRKYNSQLRKLAEAYPDHEASILALIMK